MSHPTINIEDSNSGPSTSAGPLFLEYCMFSTDLGLGQSSDGRRLAIAQENRLVVVLHLLALSGSAAAHLRGDGARGRVTVVVRCENQVKALSARAHNTAGARKGVRFRATLHVERTVDKRKCGRSRGK